MKKIETKPHSTNHSCYRIKKFRSHLISYNITPNFPHLKARLKPHISPRGKRRNYVNSREGLPWQVPILHLKKKEKKSDLNLFSLPQFFAPEFLHYTSVPLLPEEKGYQPIPTCRDFSPTMPCAAGARRVESRTLRR